MKLDKDKTRILPTPRYDGPIGTIAGGAVEIVQSRDSDINVMRFKVRTRTFARTASITDEAYMADYPDMRTTEAVVRETALHVLLDAREKINEAIADLMG